MFDVLRLVAAGGAVVALAGGSAIASADPNTDAAVNTTCTYPQVVAAMNAQSPGVAAQFNSTPAAQSWLQNFLASPPPRRQQLVDEAQGAPEAAQFVALFGPLANTCQNY